MTRPRADGITWRGTRERLARDRERLRALHRSRGTSPPVPLIASAAYLCVWLHRVAHWLHGRGRLGSARALARLGAFSTGASIDPAADLGPGLLVPAPAALALAGRAGRDLTVAALGVLARDPNSREDVGAGPGLPVLGDGVTLAPHAGVVGAVRIGARAHLGPGCIVTEHVPDGAVVEHRPPRFFARGSVTAEAPDAETCRARAHHSLAGLRRAIASDVHRYLHKSPENVAAGQHFARRVSAFLTPELLCLFLHRVSHLLHVRGWRRTARLGARLNFFCHKVSLSPASCLGTGAFLPHPAGVVFHGRAGARLTLYTFSLCTTPDATEPADPASAPALGDGVTLGVHAAVLGAISVGSDTKVAFRASLLRDAPARTIVASDAMRARAERAR